MADVAMRFWSRAGRALSGDAVKHFHQRLNDEQYQEIYDEADDAFRRSDKEQELFKFFEAVHRKLGDAGTSSLTNIQVNVTANGTFITTSYSTTFSQGRAFETFIWIQKSSVLQLHHYNIDSKVLVIN